MELWSAGKIDELEKQLPQVTIDPEDIDELQRQLAQAANDPDLVCVCTCGFSYNPKEFVWKDITIKPDTGQTGSSLERGA